VPRWLALAGIILVYQGIALADLSANADPSVQQALQDYRESAAEQQYAEAALSAKLALSYLLQDPDYDRMAYGELLTLLAEAQYNAEAYTSAIQNYQMAIKTIQSARDRLDPSLVTPFLGLSRCLAAAGEYGKAIHNYRQTVHVHQVNNGLYGVQTAELIAELSEAYYAAGDFDQANTMQDRYVAIMQRKFPGDNLARLPSMYSRADMLARTGHFLRSYKGYRRIIALVENADGTDSLKLVPVLVASANLLAGSPIVDGEDGTEKATRYLRRAVAIADSSDSANDLDKANVHITMGDFLSQTSANRRAVVRSYKRGWQYLDKNPALHAYRDEMFNNPVLLTSLPAGAPATMRDLLEKASDPTRDMNGRIVVAYDVDEGGRSDNLRVIESVPQGLHDHMVKDHVENFAFRPRFEDGEPVPSLNHTFELRYSFEDEGEDEELPDKTRQNTREVATADATQ